MAFVEITIGHTWKENVRYLHELRDVRPSGNRVDLTEIRDIIDIVVDGRNITSTVDEESVFSVIGALVDSLVSIAEGRSRKAIVEFSCEPWELVLLPTDGGIRLSLYSVGRRRRVVAHEVEADAETLHRAVSSVATSMLEDLYGISRQFATDGFVRRFSDRLEQLRETNPQALAAQREEPGERVGIRRASTSLPTGLSLQYAFDGDYLPLRHYGGEHPFDLHALLAPGEVKAEWRGATVEVADDYPLLALWGLLDRSRALLEHLETSSEDQFCAREPLPHASLAVEARGRRCRLSIPDRSEEARPPLEAELPAVECLDGFLSLAEMLVEDFLEINERLSLNHRLLHLQRETDELRRWFEDLSDENTYLDSPEQYLDDYAHIQPSRPEGADAPSFGWPVQQALRVFARRRWDFGREQIYLDRGLPSEHGLLMPCHDGLHCLDWATGEGRWSRDWTESGRPASCRPAGERLLMMSRAAGGLEGVDLEDGRTRFVAEETDCGGESALLGTTRFPEAELTVVVDRHGRTTALREDGTAAWDFDAGHGRFTGVAWGGPLVSLLSEEGFFYALAPHDGHLLWKVRLGGLASQPPRLHQGRLYAFTHDPAHRRVKVHAFYPFSGRNVWETRLEGTLAGRPSFSDRWLLLPVETPDRAQLCAIDVEAGRPDVVWRRPLHTAGLDAVRGTVDMELDGQPALLVQTDCGELTCLERRSGEVLWQVPANQPASGILTPNAPLLVGDAVVQIREDIEFRAREDGRLLHRIDSPVERANFTAAHGQFTLVLGESSHSDRAPDRLVALDLNHFLAEVG